MHAYDAGRIIKKFGTTQVMNTILFLFALRMFFYGHMISPWQVVLFEWIHGPIVGLFYPIMTSTAFKISPEGLTTTTTAIAYFMEGLGKCVSVIHCKMYVYLSRKCWVVHKLQLIQIVNLLFCLNKLLDDH